MVKGEKSKAEQVVFDLTKITPRQMQDALEAIAGGIDNKTLAEVLTHVVVACPYGEPDQIETWLDNVSWLEFREIRKLFMVAASDLTKN